MADKIPTKRKGPIVSNKELHDAVTDSQGKLLGKIGASGADIKRHVTAAIAGLIVRIDALEPTTDKALEAVEGSSHSTLYVLGAAVVFTAFGFWLRGFF